jgi:formate-dependent nitrite reductase cytochrome c552 subunit
MGFHAPAESLRILGESVDFARQGVTEIAKLRLPTAATPASPGATTAAPAATKSDPAAK